MALQFWAFILVDALKEIAKTLGKENWDFSVNPCYSWNLSKDNMVSCNCDISNDSFCHVMKMYVPFSSVSLKSEEASLFTWSL